VSNNHAIKQKVTLGQEVGQNGIIIKSGLKNNEEIVSAGASKLSNNMEVKVLNKIS
jgi:hypothetical protein